MTKRQRYREGDKPAEEEILARVWKNSRWIGQEPGLQRSIFFISVLLKWSCLLKTANQNLCRGTKIYGTCIHALCCCGPWSGSTPEKELKGAAETEGVLSGKSARGGRGRLNWLETQDRENIGGDWGKTARHFPIFEQPFKSSWQTQFSQP